MTSPTALTALTAARVAQRAYLDHYGTCFQTHCRECRELQLTISAAFARADAELEAR